MKDVYRLILLINTLDTNKHYDVCIWEDDEVSTTKFRDSLIEYATSQMEFVRDPRGYAEILFGFVRDCNKHGITLRSEKLHCIVGFDIVKESRITPEDYTDIENWLFDGKFDCQSMKHQN